MIMEHDAKIERGCTVDMVPVVCMMRMSSNNLIYLGWPYLMIWLWFECDTLVTQWTTVDAVGNMWRHDMHIWLIHLRNFMLNAEGTAQHTLVRCQLREDGLWSVPHLKAPITTGYQIRPLLYVACLVVNLCFVLVSIMDSTDYTDGVDHAVQIHAFYKPIILKENA